MEQVTRLRWASGLAGLFLLLACSGTLEDPGGANANPSGSTGSGSGASSGGADTGAGNGSATGAGPGSASGGATNTGSTGNTAGAGNAATGGSGTTGQGGSVSTGGSVTVTTPPANPGFVVARRLNHAEYNNTVRDLLGTTLTPANDFPADDLGGDFDTVGSALSLSPSYVAAYEKAAQALTTELFADATRKAKVVTCNVDIAGDSCAQTVLTAFVRRAWRRPIAAEELQALMTPLAKAKELALTPSEGLRSALTAALMSPFFVFKLEIDPDPSTKAVRKLSPHELATRLSYALWGTMPDDALNQAADGGQLSTDEQVGEQVDRMLEDTRADALLDGFAGRWLGYRDLDTHEVDKAKFPKFTAALAQAMDSEASRFVQEFLRGTRPVSELMNARFTFVNSALASHYGLTASGASATQFVRVDTTSAPRAGLLTLGALLTNTSFASRTSPVRRGEFVFSHLLCDTVPPPPPDVPTLPENASVGTLRERLEQHRADPACSGCHTLMDPIGFGLENYDAIGVYRTQDGSAQVNATGSLPDGRAFNGALELGAILANDPRFPVCVTKKFMTYAIGRLMNQPDDAAWASYLSGRSQAGGGSLPGLIRTVVLSDSFRSRQQQPL